MPKENEPTTSKQGKRRARGTLPGQLAGRGNKTGDDYVSIHPAHILNAKHDALGPSTTIGKSGRGKRPGTPRFPAITGT